MIRKGNIKEKGNPLKETDHNKEKKRVLILYNDEVNTFDHVIESLVDVCDHELYQAEQCALITHFNGKCDIKKGNYTKLKSLKDKLLNLKLNVIIE